MKASIVSTVVAAVIFFGFVPLAKSDCSNPNSILNGTYGWQAEGLLNDGSGKTRIGRFAPLVQNGYLTFDGNGNFSGIHDTSLGGHFIPHTDSGTYAVNSDCTTGTIRFATGIHFVMSFVITSGQEVKVGSAATGGVDAGALRLMESTPCSTSSISGNSYGYGTHGLVLVAKQRNIQRIGGFEPFSDVGQISFAADGTVSGLDSESLGGVVLSSLPIAGTYSVNSDCTGSITLTIGGVDQSWDLVILQGAGQITFLSTVNGVVWGGTLTKIAQ